MFKTVSAMVAFAALAAAAIITLPGLSSVNASSPVALGKSDLANPADCELRSWPYYARGCLRDEARNAARAATVRMVTTDRIRDVAMPAIDADIVPPVAQAATADAAQPEAPSSWMQSDGQVRIYVAAGDFIRRTVR